jgi:hypothetical protein
MACLLILIVGIFDYIFSQIEAAKLFLLENIIIKETFKCTKSGCDGDAKLKIIKVKKVETLQHRCGKAARQKRYNITGSKLEINKLLHRIYLLFSDANYAQFKVLLQNFLPLKKSYFFETYHKIRGGGRNYEIKVFFAQNNFIS